MNYMTDTDKVIDWRGDECLGSWILEYSHEKNDYFLNYRMLWNEIDSEIHVYKIGNSIIEIPSDFHIMIGDIYGELDWISSDELINRSVDVVILDREQKNWTLKKASFVAVKQGTVYWPKTKNIIPMNIDEKILIMSDKDVYNRTKLMNIVDLLV